MSAALLAKPFCGRVGGLAQPNATRRLRATAVVRASAEKAQVGSKRSKYRENVWSGAP